MSINRKKERPVTSDHCSIIHSVYCDLLAHGVHSLRLMHRPLSFGFSGTQVWNKSVPLCHGSTLTKLDLFHTWISSVITVICGPQYEHSVFEPDLP